MVIENVGVADKSGNDLGDLLRVVVTNVGSDPAEIRDVTVEINGTEDPNWSLKFSNYTINPRQTLQVDVVTVVLTSMISRADEVIVTLEGFDNGVNRFSNRFEVFVPSIISANPILYSPNISSSTLASDGWKLHRLNNVSNHGSASAGISISNNKIIIDSNNDHLYVLENDYFILGNFLFSSDIEWGDDDAVGFVFRYQDVFNYYWVLYTADHLSNKNVAGDGTSPHIPHVYGDTDRFVFGKVVNGTSSVIGASTSAGLMVPSSRGTYIYSWSILVEGSTFTLEFEGNEIMSVTDTTFTSGYIGFLSIAAQNSAFSNLSIMKA
ncbi:MAG: hypothetical protein D6732_28830 [Methanobacteriota archaeon]|nr:MAG: hypothetical protein D6732_28830 [Euryarchaeota archaeon]